MGQKRKKRILWITAVSAAFLIAVYLGGAGYFTRHFFPGTTVDGQDISMKTAKEMDQYLREAVQKYRLVIIDGNKKKSAIYGKEIGLQTMDADNGRALLKKQNAFLWPFYILSGRGPEMEYRVSFDEKLLEDKISALEVMGEERKQAVSAYPEFDGNSFVIKPEKYGVDQDLADEKIRMYIRELRPELDLEKEGCLKTPDYLSDSPEVTAACGELNRYCGSQITYRMGEDVVVENNRIASWLTCDASMQITLREDAVREWVHEFAEQYDTVGKVREIISPVGKTAQVSGGTYGWKIDEEAETRALMDSIRKGEILEKEPAYIQQAASHSSRDWGNTYLEVDLSSQYMWYIEDGMVALGSDVVTGEPVPEKETPSGVYSILYTQENAVLVGEPDPLTGEPIYRQKVSFWMPFTEQGHGFHDADWQSGFGGSVYQFSGSHGCVNMPVDKAGELYGMLEAGTPVILHY